jgi:hypothetical protein
VIAKHETNTVYDWSKTDNGYTVTTKTVTCANCGSKVENTSGYVAVETEPGKKIYKFYENKSSASGTPEAVKEVAVEDEKYTVKSGKDAAIVVVLNQVQHKDGLPVVECTLTDGVNDFAGDVAVTAATDAELAATGVKVYGIDGQEIPKAAAGAASTWNIPATCETTGAVVYKAVVKDPDGKVVQTRFLQDPQAVAKVAHEKGAFYGYKLLKKHYPSGATGWDTEAEAQKAADDAVKAQTVGAVDRIATVGEGAAVKYVYWAYETTVHRVATSNTNNPKYNSGLTDLNSTALTDAIDVDGSFKYIPVFFCAYDYTAGSQATTHKTVDGDAVTVNPLPNETSAADHSANTGNPKTKFSTCTAFYYTDEAITYSFKNSANEAEPTTHTWKLRFSNTSQAWDQSTWSMVTNYDGITKSTVGAKNSHSASAEKRITRQPTCALEGAATTTCSICNAGGVAVEVPKLSHTYGAYAGSTPVIGDFKDSKGTTLSGNAHTITLNEAKTEAVVTPTCEQAGGTYKWCDGTNNVVSGTKTGHWVLQTETPKTGHNLAIVTSGKWAGETGGPTGNAPDYAADKADYTYKATVLCSNPACDSPTATYEVTYHSDKTHEDTATDKYDAIEIVKEAKGKDCQTFAKTVYTVKGIKDRSQAAITKSISSTDESTKGDHAFEVKEWNWSKDYEKATITGKCTTKNCTVTAGAADAVVTQVTDASGETTFTATYGDATDVKKVYTLTNAKVEFDATKVTDLNLIPNGTTATAGAYPQTPDVTVTVNDTVINNDNLTFTWTKNTSTKEYYVTASWNTQKLPDGAVAIGTKATKPVKVAAKSTFAAPTLKVTYGGENVTVAGQTSYNEVYDPAKSFVVEATTPTVKGATVKYAVTDTEVTAKPSETTADPNALQKKIEALSYDKDAVELQDAGKYYVYAQLNKDGYTTYTSYLATITVSTATLNVTIDNTTMRQGETPVFNMVVKLNGKVVDMPQSEFVITTAGGQKLEDVIPGDYRLLVVSKSGNYNVQLTTTADGRTNTITVLTKEGKTVEQEAADVAKAADYALEDANAVKASKYTSASYAKVTEATKALKAAIASGSTADVKAATETLNKALNNLVAKKANPMKVTTKKVKATYGKTVTGKVGLKVKKAKGTKSFKKANKAGGSKIVVNKKTGKFTVKKGLKKGTYSVKVKVKAAGNGTYKAKTVTKTVKVVVK